MDADEAGIIGGGAGADPEPQPGPPPPRAGRPAREVVRFSFEEGAWILLFVALTILGASALHALGGRFAAAAQGTALFLLHGLVGLHVVRTERPKLRDWLTPRLGLAVVGAAGGAALVGINVAYGFVLERAHIAAPDVVSMLRDLVPLPVLVVWAVGFAPVVEELYFRGRLLDALDARVGRRWSGIVTSVLFAAVHGMKAFFPALLIFGFALLWLRRKTGGLVASIVAHAINNAVALFG